MKGKSLRRETLLLNAGRRNRRSSLPAQVFCLLLAWISNIQAQAGPPTNPPPARVDPKAQELIDRTIQALGGPAFLSFKRLSTRGRIFAIEDEVTAGLAPFESAVEYPDKRRLSYGKKQPVVLINNGERAWELDKYGLTNQRPEQIQRWKLSTRYGLENLLRLRTHEPGVLIQQGGVDFVDNSPVHVVQILDEQAQIKLYVHKDTFLPVRIAYRVRDPETHDWQEYADVYGDYREIQGIETPMHITRFLEGERVSEVYRNSAQYDESYPANTFQPTG